jgi:hypothetical protein
MKTILASLLLIAYAASAMDNISFVGTWKSKDGSLQLATNHTFFAAGRVGIFRLLSEMRGEWEEYDGYVRLEPMQARFGDDVHDIDHTFPLLSITGVVHVAADGSRTLRMQKDVYQYVSGEAVVVGPWEATPQREPEDIKSGWFIRPPIYPYPRFDLACEMNVAHQMEMTFAKSKSITGISGLAVWEENATNYLWRVKMNSLPLDRIVYGEFPTNSPRHSVKQVQPQLPSTPQLPSQGKRFFVRIDVDYKTMIPPSRGSDPMFFVFEFGGDGLIHRIDDVARGAVKEPKQEVVGSQ